MQTRMFIWTAVLFISTAASSHAQVLTVADTLVQGNVLMLSDDSYRFVYIAPEEGKVDSVVYFSDLTPENAIEYSIIRKIKESYTKRTGEVARQLQLRNVAYSSTAYSLSRDNVGLVHAWNVTDATARRRVFKVLVGSEEIFVHFEEDADAAGIMVDEFESRYREVFPRNRWKRIARDFLKGEECKGRR